MARQRFSFILSSRVTERDITSSRSAGRRPGRSLPRNRPRSKSQQARPPGCLKGGGQLVWVHLAFRQLFHQVEQPSAMPVEVVPIHPCAGSREQAQLAVPGAAVEALDCLGGFGAGQPLCLGNGVVPFWRPSGTPWTLRRDFTDAGIRPVLLAASATGSVWANSSSNGVHGFPAFGGRVPGTCELRSSCRSIVTKQAKELMWTAHEWMPVILDLPHYA